MGHDCCNNNSLDKDSFSYKSKHQKKALYLALFVNTFVFFCELIGGIKADSEAVLADSIHLFSHLFVIVLTLIVLNKSQIWKTRAAFLKGLLVAGLGVSIFIESFNSLFLNHHLPEASLMSFVALVAFVGNVLTLWILAKHRNDDINMRSAWTCSKADLLTNVGLILAGFFVAFLGVGWPDSLLGLIIGFSITLSSLTLIKQICHQLF